MEIPGFYFDSAKKKYFKITNGQLDNNQSRYHNNTIQSNKRQQKYSKDRTKEREYLTFDLLDYKLNGNISNHQAVNLNHDLKLLNLKEKSRIRFDSKILKISKLSPEHLIVITADYKIHHVLDGVLLFSHSIDTTIPSDSPLIHFKTFQTFKSQFLDVTIQAILIFASDVSSTIVVITFDFNPPFRIFHVSNRLLSQLNLQICNIELTSILGFVDGAFLNLIPFDEDEDDGESSLIDIVYYEGHRSLTAYADTLVSGVSYLGYNRGYFWVGCNNGLLSMLNFFSQDKPWLKIKFNSSIRSIIEIRSGSPRKSGARQFLVSSLKEIKLIEIFEDKIEVVIDYQYQNFNLGNQETSVDPTGKYFIVNQSKDQYKIYKIDQVKPLSMLTLPSQLHSLNTVQFISGVEVCVVDHSSIIWMMS